MNVTLTVTISASLLATIGSYLIGRRRTQGRVNVSEAEQLWREAREIREADQERIHLLEAVLERERAEQQRLRHDLRNQIHILQLENHDLKRRLGAG